MLFHAYDCSAERIIVLKCGCLATRTGGFAYSTDGTTWVRSPTPTFSNKVAHTDGSMSAYSTRERPKLVFRPGSSQPGETPVPMALVTGVSGNPPGWGCKQTRGVDWTFTSIQPINTGSSSRTDHS